eukprot:scaffold30594_cov154-Skeletonema_menzelii.AAC.4
MKEWDKGKQLILRGHRKSCVEERNECARFASDDIARTPPSSNLSRGVTYVKFAPPHNTTLTHPPIAEHSNHDEPVSINPQWRRGHQRHSPRGQLTVV